MNKNMVKHKNTVRISWKGCITP